MASLKTTNQCIVLENEDGVFLSLVAILACGKKEVKYFICEV